MKPNLLIVGAGGHGLVVADAAIALDNWSEIAFLDDKLEGKLLIPTCKIIGQTADASSLVGRYQDLFVAVGNNKRRLELINENLKNNFNIPTISHPKSIVSSYSSVGVGSFLAANSFIGVGARVGNGCIVNTSATVDHENLLSDGVHISPGAHLGGGVKVGSYSWIGIGANVRENISIGSNVIVGAGASVIKNIADNTQVLGVPAKPTGS